jgi:Ser/Thr protein kinase RdoA (MazF antagonist)
MLEHPQVPFVRPVTLMRWVPGRFVYRKPAPVHFERVGELMARLHNHAATWNPPRGFTRRRWDFAEYFVSETGWGGGASYNWNQIPREYRPLFKRVQRAAEKGMAALGEGPEVWGLIHADLHFHNVLMRDGAAHAIDFDDCGYGHLLSDMAVVLNRVPEHTEAFLRGYRRHRALDDDYLAYLPLFAAIRNVSVILWLAGRQVEVPGLRPIYPPLLDRFSANIRKWMGW